MGLFSDLLTFVFQNTLGQFARTSPQYIYTNMTPLQDSWLAKDMGLYFFDGDFTHEFEFEMTTAPTLEHYFSPWALSPNLIDDMFTVITNDKLLQMRIGYTVGGGGGYYAQLLEYDHGVLKVRAFSFGLAPATHYYARLVRNEALDANGRLTLYIFTGGFDGAVILAVPIALSEKADYSNAYAMNTASFSPFVVNLNGWAQNYDFGEIVIGVIIPPPLLQSGQVK